MKVILSVLLAGLLGWVVPPAGANLLTHNDNLSFEQSTLDPWVVWSPQDAFSLSTEQARTGDQSLKISTTFVESPGFTRYDITDYASAQAGVMYTGAAYYYLPAPLADYEAVGVNLIFYAWDSNLEQWNQLGDPHWAIDYGPEPGYADETTTQAWTKLEVSALAPQDTDWVGIGMQVVGRGSTFHFDDVSLIPEPGVVVLLLGSAGALGAWRRMKNRKRIAR